MERSLEHGLTAVRGLEVGHDTLPSRPTGCTVVLARGGAVAGVDVRGGAPASRELALLDPHATVSEIQAVVLTGGSAFGLDAAQGVQRALEDEGLGFDTGVARVPIVPAAALFDLAVGDRPDLRPDAASGIRALHAATSDPVQEGNVGAGAGATVGKLAGPGRAMKSGLGSAALAVPGGGTIAALFAVNALGDVVDPATGRVVAGVRSSEGDALADARRLLRGNPSQSPLGSSPLENTTLGVVATDIPLHKTEASRLARMAHTGLCQAIFPSHSPWDGDTIFALSTGRAERPVDLLSLGALAARVSSTAILRAVRAATSLPGLPAARDLEGSTSKVDVPSPS